MTLKEECVQCREAPENPWDYIPIDELEPGDPPEKVGVKREEIRLIYAVAKLVNLISPDPAKIHAISGVDFMGRAEIVVSLLKTQPRSPRPQQTSLNNYRILLEGVIELIQERGETYLKTKPLQHPTHSEILRTPWENITHGVNETSRNVIQQETGVNCFEKDEEGRLKLIKVGRKPLW